MIIEKELIKKIKEIAKEKNYKGIRGNIYKIIDDNMVHITFIFVKPKEIKYSVYLKKYNFDDIFWKIINMESNIDHADSLRVVGAFSAPNINIDAKKVLIEGDTETFVRKLINELDEKINDFLRENDIVEYILKNNDISHAAVLKCLAHIHSNNVEEAIKIAKEALDKRSYRGIMVVNEGKNFFEWLLTYYS